MRATLALALLLGVFVALTAPRAFAQLAHQLGGHGVPAAGDQKSTFHAQPFASGRQDDHA